MNFSNLIRSDLQCPRPGWTPDKRFINFEFPSAVEAITPPALAPTAGNPELAEVVQAALALRHVKGN